MNRRAAHEAEHQANLAAIAAEKEKLQAERQALADENEKRQQKYDAMKKASDEKIARLDEELKRSKQAQAKEQARLDEAELAANAQALAKSQEKMRQTAEEFRRADEKEQFDREAGESAKASMAHWHEDVSTGKSLVPVLGSGSQAYYDFKRGDYVLGAANTVNAISDVLMVKSLAKAGIKLGVMGLGMLGKDAAKVAAADVAKEVAKDAAKDAAQGGEKIVKTASEDVGKAAKELPQVNKAVNSDIQHAADQAVSRGVFSDKKSAADALRDLGKQITKDGLPPGTVPDPKRADSVLVPYGKGYAVYEITKKGTAILRTVLAGS